MNRQTAVLIFANSSQGERKFKSFDKGDAFVGKLNENILQTLKKSKLHHYFFTDKEQVGKSFGEGFSNAIKAVFEKGFESVISVGIDTPQLRKHHILPPANDDHPHVWYAILENKTEIFSYSFHSFDYDHCLTSELINKEPLPKEYVKTILTGIWDNTEILPEPESLRQGFELKL